MRMRGTHEEDTMSPVAAQKPEGGQDGWREIRHYAFVDRPYEDVWNLLAAAARSVLGDDNTDAPESVSSEIHVWRGVDLSREVGVRFGGIVCTDERARMAISWEDRRHPRLFPVLEAVLELTPLAFEHDEVTEVGLVGRYRPPFGTLGGIVDRVAGGGVAKESVAWFVEQVASRIEEMIWSRPKETAGPQSRG